MSNSNEGMWAECKNIEIIPKVNQCTSLNWFIGVHTLPNEVNALSNVNVPDCELEKIKDTLIEANQV